MNNKLPPQEPMVKIPLGLVINPVPRKYKPFDEAVMDAMVTGIGITTVNPADFYAEHLKDNDNE